MKYQISAQNINQSETWIGGFQLSVELYGFERPDALVNRDNM